MTRDSEKSEPSVTDNESEMPVAEPQFTVRELGYYTFSSSSGKLQIGTGLFDKSETLINNEDVRDTSLAINRGASPSVLLSVLALLVLITEGMLYQRRKVG